MLDVFSIKSNAVKSTVTLTSISLSENYFINERDYELSYHLNLCPFSWTFKSLLFKSSRWKLYVKLNCLFCDAKTRGRVRLGRVKKSVRCVTWPRPPLPDFLFLLLSRRLLSPVYSPTAVEEITWNNVYWLMRKTNASITVLSVY